MALQCCARILPLGALAATAESAAEWLGARVELVESLPLVHSARIVALDPICVAIIELPSTAPVAIEIEPRFAAIIVDRVLGGTGENLLPCPGGLTEVERGVLAYAIARALATAAPGLMRLTGIVTSAAALAMVLGEGGLVCWPGRARIADEIGILRAWIPERSLFDISVPRTVGPLANVLPDISLSMRLEAGRASLAAKEVGTLEFGDIVLLDDAPARPNDGKLVGEVVVRAGHLGPMWRCAIDGERFVVRTIESGRARTYAQRIRGTGMSDTNGDHSAQVLQSMGDAPIELVVELARFEMPLGELAALRPGEVLATGRAIGERVVLRAGERQIAQGELVEIEGEIGVRLISMG